MATEVLGRTNRAFPPVWLSLSVPYEPTSPTWAQELVEAARQADTVVDISSNPALWGGHMRGSDACLMSMGGLDIERATDQNHACDLVQAHLIETLSAIGREYLDLYFLRVRRGLEEFQINGALEALEMAKQEGHVRYIGLCCDGPALAVLGVWQFHDAFEVVLIPRNHYSSESYDTLAPVARERRVGVATSRPLNWGSGIPFVRLPSQWKLRNLTQSFYGLSLAQAVIADLAEPHPVLVGVRTPDEIRLAVEAPTKPRPEGLPAMLEPFREAFEDEGQWREMLADSSIELRQAAERRLETTSGGRR